MSGHCNAEWTDRKRVVDLRKVRLRRRRKRAKWERYTRKWILLTFRPHTKDWIDHKRLESNQFLEKSRNQCHSVWEGRKISWILWLEGIAVWFLRFYSCDKMVLTIEFEMGNFDIEFCRFSLDCLKNRASFLRSRPQFPTWWTEVDSSWVVPFRIKPAVQMKQNKTKNNKCFALLSYGMIKHFPSDSCKYSVKDKILT